MNHAKIYLCKADLSLLGTLTGIQTESCSLTQNATDLWQITFDVNRFEDRNGELVQSSYYDSIDDMMKLYLDSDEVQAFFVIDSEPGIKGDGYQEVKTVTAHSIECELNNVYLKNFKINCGTSDSQEYLAKDSKENYYNINPYTGLPYEYISLVNYDDQQLSLMHLALQGTGWTVKERLDSETCQIKKSFDISDNSVYSFLMKTVSPAASVIFEFDRKHRQVGFVKAEDYGEDTGVFITMRNLMNRFDVTGSSNDNIITKLVPSGANNLGIKYVNFGRDSVLNLDYFMNTLNEYGDYKFVSTDLHDKYNQWKHYRETEQITCDKFFGDKFFTRRELYAELTKLYNKADLDISELTNRVPNDGCQIDYRTYKLEELQTAYTAYNNALLTLITTYKNEFGVTEIGNAPEYTPTPSTATNIKDTPYWYDFYAYKEQIIPSVEQALKMYCQTDSNGNLVTDKKGHFIEIASGNPDYYTNQSIIEDINSYLYEWSLYGLDELEAKKKAWSEAANLLFHECFIRTGTLVSPTSYRTPDDSEETGWNSLSAEQQGEFTTKDAFFNRLNQYLDYMSFEKRTNSITKTDCIGIIRQCEHAIKGRKRKIRKIKRRQRKYQSLRDTLAKSVTLENFSIDGENPLFTEDDQTILHSMMREQEYNNDNILITNLDDTVSTVDAQEQLYQAAVEKLYEISQPQYSFKTELDNLYSLQEFASYQKTFRIGNFIRVGTETHEELFDNLFIKLRVISMSYNPLEISENLSVEFSTMTKSLNGISDLAFLLDSESSSGGTSSSSPSSGGTYGNNNANVQISNNMLNALLGTEMFGTAVTDVILDSMKANKGNFNSLFARSGAFDSLEAGELKINGDCLFDKVKSSNWNGSESDPLDNSEGSIISLSDGKFSFGGGKLKWDGKDLSVSGTLKGCDGHFKGSLNVNGNFVVDEEGNVTANNAEITGKINATNSVISESTVAGEIYAEYLDAQKGKIAGWSFNENALYQNSSAFRSKDGKYFGTKGLSLGSVFVVDDEGFLLKDIHGDTIKNTSILCNNMSDAGNAFIDRIYVYGYKNYDANQIFSLFVWKSTSFHFDKPANKDSNHEFIAARYQYIFNKTAIRNVTPLDLKSEKFTDGLIEYIDINKMGYVILDDLEFVTTDFDKHLEDLEPPDPSYTVDSIKIAEISTKEASLTSDIDWRVDYCPIDIVGVYYSNNTYDRISEVSVGMTVDSYNKRIKMDDTFMTNEGFSSKYMYDNVTVSGKALYINSDGTIGVSGSSKRFKNSVSTNLTDISDPHGLYDINVVQYKYNDNYFSSPHDEGLGKYFIGFIAEDIAEKFKDGATFDQYHLPDGWDIRYMFPAALKLIQEQHRDIENLKEEIKELKEKLKGEV